MRRFILVTLVLMAAVARPLPGAEPQSILIIYDNTTARAGLVPDWGFAAQVLYRSHNVLFDSGTKPEVLAANMKALSVDPSGFEFGIFSHPHQDHLGGLAAVLRLHPGLTVYFLDTFPAAALTSAERLGAKPGRIASARELLPGLFTTGPVAGNPVEQALVIDTPTGLVVLTGCSHPGILNMVEAARRVKPGAPVRLVVGGFHMLRDSEAQIKAVVSRLRGIGVQSILPTHCTGELATKLFREAFGEKCLRGGAGVRISLD